VLSTNQSVGMTELSRPPFPLTARSFFEAAAQGNGSSWLAATRARRCFAAAAERCPDSVVAHKQLVDVAPN